MANDRLVWEGMTDDERKIFDDFGRTGLMNSVTNRFRLSPDMSYVAPETVAVDPGFWNRER